MANYDFSGWATRSNIKCSDGRTILKDAFKDCDGKTVPLIWNHQHNEADNVLGHALLENREEGVYAYCTCNDTPAGKKAKAIVQHGDVTALSIYANRLKQNGSNVIHGAIREVSLVLAGANPEALIDMVISHSDDIDGEAIIFTGENICLSHAEETKEEDAKNMAEENKDKTVQEVFDELTEEQKTVVYALVGQAVEDALNENETKTGDDKEMKHNVFDNENVNESNVLTHADQSTILANAKKSGIGSLKQAMEIYAEENSLQHAFTDGDLEALFPEYKDVKPGAPELILNDSGWVSAVMKKVHKSPLSRIRTRQMDARGADLRAKGYKKPNEKGYIGNMKLLSRTTDPQTIYVKDKLHRDDIIDITDFDAVNYVYGVMKEKMYEEIALAIMIGDGREDGVEDKISESHVRSIWNDDELYTIHRTVDMAAVKAELQGTNSNANFGENYLYSEAIIQEALYAREQYKGKGNLDFYCTPHALNVMLLAKDLNGRRIYDSKADLARALNVSEIYTAEQFEGRTRKTEAGETKKLLGIFVNLSEYSVGSTKGGELTKFNQFDIDFNQEKYLLETRMSGALTNIKSAIVLEENVAE